MALHNLVPVASLASSMQPWLTLIPMALTGGLGYWWGHRGVSGMQADLALLKTDVSYLKGKFDGTPTPTPVVPPPVQPASV